MLHLIYNTALTLACPVGAAWLALSQKHRPLLARFAPDIPEAFADPIWIHACSVGEVGVAKPIIEAMKRRWPDCPILLTSSTAAGLTQARSSCPDVGATWFPFDHPLTVRSFVHRAQPRALLLVETEIWPNVLKEMHRAGRPTILVNGRISDKHYGRYLRLRSFFQAALRYLTIAGVQNQEYGGRLAALGMEPSRIRVTGVTKFDGVTTSVPESALDQAREESGFAPREPILVFGSTRPGDEALAARCWNALRGAFPSLRLVVAVRHADRLEEAMAPFDEPILKRSEVKHGRRPQGERILFLDTVGELVRFYALATVAVVGGSFYAGVNGHNPIEPAALGVATVFGPFMGNFIDHARVLVQSKGAIQVESPDALCGELERLLADESARSEMARRAGEAIAENQGAIERNLDLVESLLP